MLKRIGEIAYLLVFVAWLAVFMVAFLVYVPVLVAVHVVSPPRAERLDAWYMDTFAPRPLG